MGLQIKKRTFHCCFKSTKRCMLPLTMEVDEMQEANEITKIPELDEGKRNELGSPAVSSHRVREEEEKRVKTQK